MAASWRLQQRAHLPPQPHDSPFKQSNTSYITRTAPRWACIARVAGSDHDSHNFPAQPQSNTIQPDSNTPEPTPTQPQQQHLSLTERLRSKYAANTPTPAAQPRAGTPASGVLAKALGVDYGTVWTGLAVKVADGLYEPLQVVRTQGSVAVAAKAVLAEGQRQGVDGFVVGLPLSQGGHLLRPSTDNPHARRCRQFAHNLALMASRHGLAVILYNEADTTRMAKYQSNIYAQPGAALTTASRQKQQTDAWAARMLLHLYYAQPQLAVRVKC